MKNYEALELQAKAMRLVEGTELKWWQCIKYLGNVHCSTGFSFLDPSNYYELALAIVEGKPVFNLDRLFYKGHPYIAGKAADFSCKSDWSWLPQKPKTVLVELPYQSAVNAVEKKQVDYSGYFYACRKALEAL
jgi:hypothetical protein